MVGTGNLAEATYDNCQRHFTMVDEPNDASMVWFCETTPVDINDLSDTATIFAKMSAALYGTPNSIPFVISSQLPVGSCARMEAEFPNHCLIVQPENIRVRTNLSDFSNQHRMIVGTRRIFDTRAKIVDILGHFTDHIIWMSPESAEMSKHVLNSYLAMNIAFANEMADLCKLVGADIADVFNGFRSDHRVGDLSPLQPGKPYSGGTLGRDVRVLSDEASEYVFSGKRFALIRSIARSNTDRLLYDDRFLKSGATIDAG